MTQTSIKTSYLWCDMVWFLRVPDWTPLGDSARCCTAGAASADFGGEKLPQRQIGPQMALDGPDGARWLQSWSLKKGSTSRRQWISRWSGWFWVWSSQDGWKRTIWINFFSGSTLSFLNLSICCTLDLPVSSSYMCVLSFRLTRCRRCRWLKEIGSAAKLTCRWRLRPWQRLQRPIQCPDSTECTDGNMKDLTWFTWDLPQGMAFFDETDVQNPKSMGF